MSYYTTTDRRASHLEFESLDDATHWLQLHGARWARVIVDGSAWLLGCDGSAELWPDKAQVPHG